MIRICLFLLIFSQLACVNKTKTLEERIVYCPPDKTPVIVPNEAPSQFRQTTEKYNSNLKVSFDIIEKVKANVGASIKPEITKLAEDLDQRTIRSQMFLTTVFEWFRTHPCESSNNYYKFIDLLIANNAKLETINNEIVKEITQQGYGSINNSSNNILRFLTQIDDLTKEIDSTALNVIDN